MTWIPDVNLLLAASRSDHPQFAPASAWLDAALSASADGEGIDLLPVVAAGVLRLATHPRIFREPTPAAAVFAFLDMLLSHPGVRVSAIGTAEWVACRSLCEQRGLAGNDVSDALIAACVITSGARLVTFDRGFVRLLPKRQLRILDSRRSP